MSKGNPNPKTDHLKPYQIPAKLRPEDKKVMKDMIEAGTLSKAFIDFWTKEVGITYRTAEAYYNRLKKTI